MLLVPVTGKLSWRNPPYVTIALIIINILVFVLFQRNDTHKWVDAEAFYQRSGLMQIELRAFMTYRISRDASLPEAEISAQTIPHLRDAARRDSHFQALLSEDRIITSGDRRYPEWKRLRREYEHRLAQVVSHRHGFRPAQHRFDTFFTHMFLHGGWGHLIGNMVFLWLTGCLLEMGQGRIYFWGCYLLCGLGAVCLFWAVYPQSTIPLVGASGAISGIMGAFALLFNRQRVKIFFSVGFYFNYLKIPAFILLPIWISKEVVALMADGGSQIAYVAHLGGFITGGLAGYLHLKFLKPVPAEILLEEPQDPVAPILEQALLRIRRLDLEGGQSLLEQALEIDPHRIDVLTQLFNVLKTKPHSERFHEITRILIALLGKQRDTYKTAAEIFQAYTRAAAKPRLTAAAYLKMATVLAELGRPEKAVPLLNAILKSRQDHPGLPPALYRLARAYHRQGVEAKKARIVHLLQKRFPSSPEARLAAGLTSET